MREKAVVDLNSLIKPHVNLLGMQMDKFGKMSQLPGPGIHTIGNMTKQLLKVCTHELVLAVVFSSLERYNSEIKKGN